MNKPVRWGFATHGWFPIWWHWLLIAVFMRLVELSIFVLRPSPSGLLLLGVFGGGLWATLQWSVIRRLIKDRSRSWIGVTWLGYLLSTILSRPSFATLERFLDLRPRFTEYDRVVLLFYLFWLVQALLLGILQAAQLHRWSKIGLAWVFVLTFSRALEFALIFPTSALASLLHSPSMTGFVVTVLAIVLTSSLTGWGLLGILNPAFQQNTLVSE